MKRSILRFVVLVALVIPGGVVVGEQAGAAPATSHSITATDGDVVAVKAAFLGFKIRNNDMLSTDRITWGRVRTPSGLHKVDIAYDAVDHREWAIASFNLVHPASLKAEISFQDGGNFGVFNKIGSGQWFMIWSPALPLCPGEFPSVVARLWGPKMFAACS
jgi:hypothetical protein